MEKIFALLDHIKIIHDHKEEEQFLDELYNRSRSETIRLAFVNAHAFNLCHTNSEFLNDLLSCDYVLRDGAGMKILYGLLEKEASLNMNGTDFIPKILARFSGEGMALLGTRSPYLENAAEKIQADSMSIVALKDGFQSGEEYVHTLEEKNPGLILLSMGMPKQERVAFTLNNSISSPALIVCGGAIADFIAERFPRAPVFLQKVGLEWTYRLSKEPVRLFRRYVIGNVVFLLRAIYVAFWMKRPLSSPRKILHVVRQYSPSIGGMESYVASLIAQQKKMGYDCEVITLNKVFHSDHGKLLSHEMIDGIPVKRISFFGMRRFFVPFVSPLYFKKFDLVHVHNTDVFYDYIALCSWIFRFPAVAVTHGGFFHTKNFSSIKKLYFNTITRLSTSLYKGVIAISQQDFDKFKKLRSDVVYLPNAIEPLAHEISQGQDFLYIGRLSENKNVPDVIRLFSELKKTSKIQGKLRIVGPEWDVSISDLETIARSLSVRDDVILHGSMTREEMKEIIKKCGFFVSASTFEGFGMSMLEGMSGGLIPFVQNNDSFNELITKCGCGLLLDYKEIKNSTKAIVDYFPNIDSAMRQHAMEFSLSYSWPKLGQDIDAFYNEKVWPWYS